MGLLSVEPYLLPAMRRALEKSHAAVQKCCETLGIEAADPQAADPRDVSLARTLYAAERAYWNAQAPDLAFVEDFFLPGPAGDIPARHYSLNADSEAGRPIVIFLHGGGWIVGSRDTHDRICRVLVLESGWDVISVAYRLAPENPFPASVEDCMAAVDWVVSDGIARNLDPTRIAVAGDSAGANMAMACLIHARNQGHAGQLRAGLLFYGAYGLSDGASRRLWGGPEDGLSPADLKFYRDCLFAGSADRADSTDPRYNILAADLTGLPPLHILEVTMDPLADDSAALARAAAASGVAVDHVRADGVLHGYLHMNREVPQALHALQEAGRFLAERA